jgi:ankyrin repeat protein
MLKEILRFVKDVDQVDNNGQTAAHICAKQGELECLKLLAANSADLHLTDKNGMGLSHLAAQYNHYAVLEFLFYIGNSLVKRTPNGKLPLHYAAQHGSFESVKMLTKYYVDVNQLDNEGNYAAHFAAMNNKLQCLKYLIRIGTPLGKCQNRRGRNLAHVAALHGASHCLHWLLEKGCDTTEIDSKSNETNGLESNFGLTNVFLKDDGNTVAHLACLGSDAKCLNCCLQHDCNMNALNKSDEKPLNIARRVGKLLYLEKACKSVSDVLRFALSIYHSDRMFK